MIVFRLRRWTFIVVLFLGNNTTFASLDSIGLNGIHSDNLTLFNGMPLTGDNVEIGQVETGRPALVGTDTLPNASVVPTAITLKAGGPVVMDADLGDGHATQVAGVMISTDSVDSNVPPNGDAPRGVAINANLYSSAYQVGGIAGYNDAILTTQYVAIVNNDVRAINHSWGKPKANAGDLLDGNSQ